MGSPEKDKKKEKKKVKEEKPEVKLEDLVVEEEVRPIKEEVISSGLELNIAAPAFIAKKEISPATQAEVAPREFSVTQSEVAPRAIRVSGEPSISVPRAKPRDKILVKADELMAKAQTLIGEYKYEAAMQQLTARVNLLKNTAYKDELAQTYLYMGHTLNTIRKSDEAKLLLQEGIKVLQGSRSESATIMANLRVELGIALQKLANYKEALDEFNKAGRIYRDNQDHSGYVNTLWNKGILFYNTQDWKKAVEVYLEIARESAEQPGAISNRLKSLQKVADLIQTVGGIVGEGLDPAQYLKEIHHIKDDYEKALAHEMRLMTKSRELERIERDEAQDPANLALWHFNLAAAELTASSGDISSAITHYNKSIELYKKIGDKFGLSRCYQHLAFIKDKQGDTKEAARLLRECIQLREDLKESLTVEEYRTALQEEIVPLYDDLSYLEAKLENYEASLNAIEQSKSRELIKHLANESLDTCPYVKNLLQEEEKSLAHLRDLERDLYHFGMRYCEIARRGGELPQMAQDREKLEKEIAELHTKLQECRRDVWMKCIDSGNVKPPLQYDILSKVLEVFNQEKHWAILEFIWNPIKATLMVFFITPEATKLFQSDLTSKELDTIIASYKTALIEGDEKKLQDAAKKFSTKIIPAGIYQELDASDLIQYLFIIPHKQLNSIPFEIIYHKNQYWGQKYCVIRNYSLDLSRITLQKRMKFLQEHPTLKNSALIVGNPTLDLPNAEIEAREVARMLKDKGFKVQLLLTKKSKEADFVKNAKDQTIIHFAGHGIFITPEPILSQLLFASSALTAREVTQLKLNIPIVVLSACETAISGSLGGEELVGFVRSFILAGSTTIVTTNWPVSDVSAQELVEKFYEFLLMGASAGIALQKARQFIAQKYQNKISHWAAYTLFGDPFRKIL